MALKSFLELLPGKRDDPEFETRFLAVAREELRRAERLLDAIVEARGEVLRAGPPGDAVVAVAAVALLVGPRARARDVRVETRVEPALELAVLGADALRQVLLNLALNAIDASPAGACVRIAARSAGGGLELGVADEGPGMAAAARDERPARPGGLGLGITRRLVEAAGGSLAVHALPGGGTEVLAWLPAAPRPAGARDPATRA